jgi:hypothetical protein
LLAFQAMFEGIAEDVRNGFRALRRGRGVTTMAVCTLALGIGVNTAIFSVAHAFLLRVWQVHEPQRLTFVRARGADGQRIGDFPWTTVERLRLPMQSFSGMSAIDGSTITVTIEGDPEVVYADFVTGDYFQLLGVSTPLGRPLTSDDDRPGQPAVAVISDVAQRVRPEGPHHLRDAGTFARRSHLRGRAAGTRHAVSAGARRGTHRRTRCS